MKRLLSLCLAAVLLVCIGVPAKAETALPAAEASAEAQSVTRVRELEGLRETNTETYLLSDGKLEYVIYSEDKYYEDSTGKLKAIDNTIAPISAAKLGSLYKNAGNSFDTYFSSAGTPTVSVQKDGYSVAFSPAQSTQDQLMSTQIAGTMSVGAVEQCATLAALTATGENTVSYTNAFGTADLVYVLTNSALKEYIILENSAAPASYSFAVTLGGLTVQQTGGVILLVDSDGNEVFSLGSLFAVDAAGVETEAVTCTVTSGTDQNTALMTVTLDSSYLTDPQRVFPVVIDPTIMISSAQTKDSYVSSANPNTNYYKVQSLRTGKDSPYGVRRSYISFDLPKGLSFMAIEGATLDIKKKSGVTPTIRAYPCKASWESNTITWNNQPGYWESSASGYATLRSNGTDWYTIDVGDIVWDWYMGGGNYGFMIKDDTETSTTHWTTFASSDAPSPNKPELHITVKPATICVNLMYDQSYLARNSQASSTMLSHAQELQELYLNQFGISVVLNSPTQITSYADQCSADKDAYCDHGTCSNSILPNGSAALYHHTNMYNIIRRIPYPNNTTTVTVVYTGHVTCMIPAMSSVCVQSASFGLCEEAVGICLVEATGTNARILQTLIHEFGHFYEVQDHYGVNGAPHTSDLGADKGFSMDCIYGENKESVGSQTICDGCISIIKDNRDKYN